MNTGVSAWLWSESPLAPERLVETEPLFAAAEVELSRFKPDSALSRLNSRAGAGPQAVSPVLVEVLSAALAAADDSDGIFDPTLLIALQRAGYNRSFELLGANETVHPLQRASEKPEIRTIRAGWRQVQLDPERNSVTLPSGLGIDLGGIAKGWTVDRAAERLAPWGAALVDAGGDLRATAAPAGEPWPVGLQDPFDEESDLFVVGLESGAIATSSIGRRRWERDGQAMHHLIDPRSGRPSRSDLHTVTVLAQTAIEAEVAAKAALILGRRAGRRYLETRGLSGALIGCDRSIEVAGKLPLVDTIR